MSKHIDDSDIVKSYRIAVLSSLRQTNGNDPLQLWRENLLAIDRNRLFSIHLRRNSQTRSRRKKSSCPVRSFRGSTGRRDERREAYFRFARGKLRYRYDLIRRSAH